MNDNQDQKEPCCPLCEAARRDGREGLKLYIVTGLQVRKARDMDTERVTLCVPVLAASEHEAVEAAERQHGWGNGYTSSSHWDSISARELIIAS